MAPRAAAVEASPESDRIDDCPHPRETYDLFGQPEAEHEILKAYQSNALPQAIILGGPAGIGKATLAWRTARFLLAHPNPAAPEVQAAKDLSVAPDHQASRQVAALSHTDLVLLRREWNEKTKKFFSEIRTEDVRGAIHLFQQAAGAGGYRICIVDGAEDLNRSGANALLKTIEEPPPKSLFLIVAHRPDMLLPTIRSRSRRILLKPLSESSILQILDRLGSPWSEIAPAERAEAAARAQGSLHDALRLLAGGGVAFDSRVRAMLEALPQLDWQAVHGLADQIAGRDGLADYETLMITIIDWLDGSIRARAEAGEAGGAMRLAPLAEVWEKVAEAARETEVLNLDKRPLVLSIFADLAAAARASSS
jgi:DNA polymerase-3 subunit delta'